jgi:TolB protein
MYRLTKPMFFLLIVLVSCASPEKKQTSEEINPTLILEKEGVEYAYPHFSKDAVKIIFQSNESGNWRICTVNMDGNDIKELTTDTANCYFPDWSPENDHICFVSDRTGNEEIYLMNADGSNQVQLTNNKARNIHPYFSPDGKKILFNSTWQSTDDLEVYQMNPDGTGIARITNTPDNESCARMSPDNAHIIYLKNNNKGLDDLFLFTITDSSETNLTKTPTMDGWPSWMPDGKQIVFSAVEDDVYKLFTYHLNDKSISRLTNPSSPNDDCRANVSPDGKMIVFNRQRDTEIGRTNSIYILRL